MAAARYVLTAAALFHSVDALDNGLALQPPMGWTSVSVSPDASAISLTLAGRQAQPRPGSAASACCTATRAPPVLRLERHLAAVDHRWPG
jgi:hypothetical protein